jgi:hypothetical protein
MPTAAKPENKKWPGAIFDVAHDGRRVAAKDGRQQKRRERFCAQAPEG